MIVNKKQKSWTIGTLFIIILVVGLFYFSSSLFSLFSIIPEINESKPSIENITYTGGGERGSIERYQPMLLSYGFFQYEHSDEYYPETNTSEFEISFDFYQFRWDEGGYCEVFQKSTGDGSIMLEVGVDTWPDPTKNMVTLSVYPTGADCGEIPCIFCENCGEYELNEWNNLKINRNETGDWKVTLNNNITEAGHAQSAFYNEEPIQTGICNMYVKNFIWNEIQIYTDNEHLEHWRLI